MQKKIYIYGKHAVGEALRYKPHIVRTLYLAHKEGDEGLRRLAERAGVKVERLDPRKATSQVERNAPHQGAIALVSLSGLVVPFEQFFDKFSPDADTALVLLSDVQDPHNVGAVVRSAAALGAAAVLLPARAQSPLTGAAVKASAGAALRLPLVSVGNLQQALAHLKKKGVRIYGLRGGSGVSAGEEPFDAPALFVLGNEARGIEPAAAALCDTMLSVPIHPRAESLNVAAAAAAVLFAWSTRHPGALKK